MDPLAKHGNCDEWYGCYGRFDCLSCGASYVREYGAWIVRRPGRLIEPEPGPCDDPSCPVLHADPANPIHPPNG